MMRLRKVKTTRAIRKRDSWLKKQLVKLYLKAPPKVQLALARQGIRHVLKKKKAHLENVLKH
jgi:hypothetical protein